MSEPLAAALRPKTLDAFVGQPHLMAKDAPFRKSIENEFSSSVLLWGPPGCGKTTLALILAARSKRQFVRLSAVSDGMNDLRKHVQNAHARHRLDGSGLLMFVDEIHRWNKAQQDALLPHVESGLILLIGATTENPSFSVIPALRSRCWTLPLHPLEIDDLCRTLERGCKHLDLTLPQTHLKHIARYSGGDARRALSLLERVSCASSGAIKEEELFLLLGNKDTLHDSSGEMHYNVTSAFIKSMRGSDPDAALYWMARLLQAGEDPMFVARRMVIFASEDIGNADLRALPIATAALQSTHLIGMPEARIVLGQCCVYLATAPKSNAAYKAINAAIRHVEQTGSVAVPTHIADPPIGYKYPHDYPDGFVRQEYWPKEIQQVFYRPTNYGDEQIIAQRLEWWERRKGSS